MVVGPMKKRMIISFMVGFFIMLLIAGVVLVLLYRQYDAVKQEKDALEKNLTTVCVTSRAIVATEAITVNDLQEKRINVNAVPATAYSSKVAFESDANDIEEGAVKARYSKIAIDANTILLPSMLYIDSPITSDVRIQEFNMLLLPSKLQKDDYIDIRLLLPTGNDYVVCSKKRVKEATEGTIWLDLGELDTQYISSAIIESYLTEGSILYAIEYSEPSLQEEAKVTYPVLPAVKEFAIQNPNIVAQVQNELSTRLTTYDYNRNILDANSESYKPDDPVATLIQKVLEQVQKQQEERANNMSAQQAATQVQ